MLDLEKKFEIGSLRWVGQTYNSFFPDKTVIAGKSLESISEAIGMPCYKLGRISQNNVFVAHDSLDIFYVYVNPSYSAYRRAFAKVVGSVAAGYHVDHVLSKNLAIHFGYNYVLLCMIPGRVNKRHGYYEKIKINLIEDVPDVCYPDDRIYHKILSRNPTARNKREDLLNGYAPENIIKYGLTLKQKGLWNVAFGFDVADMFSIVRKTSVINV
ncbi:hypothetical protein [Hymenobacter cellulosivorans]|uniref:Uncharacterized protein n=1 Tax=Hymenobacter cellulosivorans TaxID=2932249 RepID=A0ABY4F393_9BACT|nr:hypothetical protein [Hymenobacter cellulosivorans]UOQ50701.1 hypothetical protein MUN80_13120 [Hymenobacter cellulosivorans]